MSRRLFFILALVPILLCSCLSSRTKGDGVAFITVAEEEFPMQTAVALDVEPEEVEEPVAEEEALPPEPEVIIQYVEVPVEVPVEVEVIKEVQVPVEVIREVIKEVPTEPVTRLGDWELPRWFVYTSTFLIFSTLVCLGYISKQRHRHN